MTLFKKKYFLLFLTFFLAFPFILPNIRDRIFLKLYSFRNKYYLSQVKNSQNCDLDYISYIPNNSSIIIGHAYGSPYSENGFINIKLENFLKNNKSKLNNIYFTGDVFHTPSPKKWKILQKLVPSEINFFFAPGNHDLGSNKNFDLFNEYVTQLNSYPISFETQYFKFFIENSVKNNWQISKKIISAVNKYNGDKLIVLLRHNIPVRELIPISNSSDGLDLNLHSENELLKRFDKKIIIISGDGGAFEKLPRFYCKNVKNITFIVNGLGGIKNDTIIVLSNGNLFKYNLNSTY